MTYSRRNLTEEQNEAYQKASYLQALCEQFNISLDPMNWQRDGMQTPVTVNRTPIASLWDLSQGNDEDILRQVRMKLFERAALDTMHEQSSDLKATIWSPVAVREPQDFLSLWIITIETGRRISIMETISNGQRVYEPYRLDKASLAQLFGPLSEGEFQLGEKVTLQEHQQQYTGEIIYIISPPDKTGTSRTPGSRGYHRLSGKAYTNDVASRYLVDCQDGFPHLVSQSQVTRETSSSPE